MKVRIVINPPSWMDSASIAEPPPQALVDVHSHCLWGLDDGAKSFDDSLAMLKMAARHGTTDIVVTPHANFQYPFDPAVIAERLAALRAHPDLPVRLHNGCDFHLSFGNIREALANPHKFTINGLKYLLVEFADNLIPPTIEEVLRRFLAQDVVPIVTHPERNPVLQQSVSRMRDWVSMGCLLQITGQSLSGEFGKFAKRSAWELVKEDLAHIVASDAHDTSYRTTRLDGAWRLLKQEVNEMVASRLLIHNPQAVIQGCPLYETAHTPWSDEAVLKP